MSNVTSNNKNANLNLKNKWRFKVFSIQWGGYKMSSKQTFSETVRCYKLCGSGLALWQALQMFINNALKRQTQTVNHILDEC